MKPLISIIIPLYQVEEFIANAVNSIIKQTYTYIEVVLVNDGSTDKSAEIACKLLEQSNIKYTLINQENRGIASARNAGIRNSKGEWIMMVDSDDVIAPNLIERSYEVSVKYGLGIVFCNFQYVSFENISKKSIVENEDLVIQQNEILNLFLKRQIRLIFPGMLIRKDLIELNDFWLDETIKYGSEQHLIWKLLFRTNEVAYIKDQLYNYLVRGGNSIMASSSINAIITGFNSMERLQSEIIQNQKIKKFILPRWIFGALKTSAKRMDFQNFSELSLKMHYKKHMKNLKFFPDIRISILSTVMVINLRMFYLIIKSSK
jgi:glycosyltransferase involved in cell wall biosynthesis